MNKKSNTIWTEKYRPQTLDTYIGNDHLKGKAKVYIESGDIPHLLLYGRAGTGKTTLAKILVSHINCDYLYINASDENSVDVMRNKIKDFASSIGFKDLKVVILDEADFTTPQSQAALRNIMETFSSTTRFILTANYVEKIISPIQSRCQLFDVVPPSRKEIAVRLAEILDTENVKYDVKDLAVIVNAGYPDIRRVINSTQRQVINGGLKVDTAAVIAADYKLKLLEHLKKDPKKKAFTNIRQLLADSQVRDFTELFKLLYDEIDSYAGDNIGSVILILAEHQYMDAFVTDKEINMMAAISKILDEIK